jgi:manganese-dependent ADP-ribose/CDP-alcohol diphosphatase
MNPAGISRKAVISKLLITLVVIFQGCQIFSKNPNNTEGVRIGLVADIQYADKETRGRREYRTAIHKFEEFVNEMNKQSPEFVIQLGDIIDGHSNDLLRSNIDLDHVLSVFDRLSMPAYHVIGNHCLLAGEDSLKKKLGLEKFYYDFTHPRTKGWRFIVLDGNDAGYGIIGEEQLRWFRSKLQQACGAGEKVMVFSHYALLKEAAGDHRMAEPESLLRAIGNYSCVIAWFAGHDHGGGYAFHDGVHHLTLRGMVEAPVNNSFALVELYTDFIRVTGFGEEETRELMLRKR